MGFLNLSPNTIVRSLALAALCFMLGCSPLRLPAPLVMSPGDWPMYGKNSGHTGFADSTEFTFPMSPLWTYNASAGFGPGAVSVADGILFIGTLQGELHAVDAVTGKRIGYKKFRSPISGSPAVDGSMVYFGTEGGKNTFFAFDLVESDTRWSSPLGGIASSPLLINGKLYVGNLAGVLYCIDPLSGDEHWNYDSKAAIHSSPVAADSLIVFANDAGVVYCLDGRNGLEVWRYQTGAAIFGAAMVAGGMVFVGSRDHLLYAIEATNGRLRWKYDAGDRIVSTPSSNDSLVFAASLAGTLAALSRKDGHCAWKFKANSVINSTAAITRTAVFVGSLDTELYALSPETGSVLWKFNIESRIKTSLVVWKDFLYVLAEDRSVHCFRSTNNVASGR